MLPGPNLIIRCPHCGGEKALLSLASGNTFGGTQWWDLRTDYPMLPQTSPIQRCPHCGKYFLLRKAKSRYEEHDRPSPSLDTDTSALDEYLARKAEERRRIPYGHTGELSYPEAREAWAQLHTELKRDDLTQLALIGLHRYNDTFLREGFVAPEHDPRTDDDLAFAREMVEVLLKHFKVESPLIQAEFLREVGEFDRAMAILNASPRPQEAVYAALYDYIKDCCAVRYTAVGKVSC